MDFKTIYVQAMREHQPKQFNELVRSGRIEAYLQERSKEAHAMLRDLLKDEPRGPGGAVSNLAKERAAEEQVLAVFLDFPQPESEQNPEPPDDLPKRSTLTSKAPTTGSTRAA